MFSSSFSILILALVAAFLLIKLRNVLGTRTGFEKPPEAPLKSAKAETGKVAVANETQENLLLEMDEDLLENVRDRTEAAKAVGAIHAIDDEFYLSTFLEGAKGAFEWIFVQYETGNLEDIRPYLSQGRC